MRDTLAQKGHIYGVTTGYGDSCTELVPQEHYSDLQVHLTRYHGCGMGAYFIAIMNGTAVMNAIAALALDRARLRTPHGISQ